MTRPVLLSRPQAQIHGTAQFLRDHGYDVITVPLTGIAPPARKPSRTQLQNAQRADWLAFTSRNAVQAACTLLHPQAGQKILAIGEATAKALRAANWPVDWLPPDFSSESLLNTPDRPELSGRIVIVGGSGGRRSLKTGLQSSGAQVSKLIVYRRVGLIPARQALLNALKVGPILVFSSGHALRQWHRVAHDYQLNTAFDLPLLVASRRLCKLARQLGFSQDVQPLARMSDAALLAALQEHNA
jgi:uroporphyrinogen-III synthase